VLGSFFCFPSTNSLPCHADSCTGDTLPRMSHDSLSWCLQCGAPCISQGHRLDISRCLTKGGCLLWFPHLAERGLSLCPPASLPCHPVSSPPRSWCISCSKLILPSQQPQGTGTLTPQAAKVPSTWEIPRAACCLCLWSGPRQGWVWSLSH
jgi:hypothetical protein